MEVDSTISAQEDEILKSEDMRKIFVGGIPKDQSDEDIKTFFEGVIGGTVTDQVIIRKETGKSYFGFITFETSNMVDEVIFKEKELTMNGTTVEVKRACPKKTYQTGAHHKTKKLFIAGIPKDGLKEEELKEFFEARHDSRYGTIESVQFIKKKDESGTPLDENKGFGFVTVSSEHLADTMSIQHATININGQKLELKKSDRDGQSGGRGGFRGGRGGGGRGAAQQWGGWGGYGGYGGYGYDQWGYGYGGYDGYGGYGQQYPQYGVSSATARGGSGGGASGGRGAGAGRGGGKRFTPYAKQT